MNFGQIITAMVTPFDQDGEIDFNATKNLVNYLIENGSDGLVVTGTTGESPTLTTEEKVELYKFVVEVVDGRIPVIAGTGSNNTKASIQLTKLAEQAGVDGIMLVVPYYNKPSQEGLFQHFKAIADSTVLPIILYNIPGRSVVNLSIETTLRLANLPNVVALKDATGNLESMTEIIRQTPADFDVYTGEDALTLPTLSIGGSGVISVAAHIIGNEMQTMIRHFKNGNYQEAALIQQNIAPVIKALFAQSNPTPVKAALNDSGVPVGGVRLPLVPLNDDELHALQQVLNLAVQNQKVG
nr:4-hydroxy-tetrahydrodipicolinate synthase [uncultured Bacillus sp.]